MSHVAKVSSKGWIVIPKELREKYNISVGQQILLTDEDDSLTIHPIPEDPISAYKGLFKGTPLAEELLKARKEETDNEELRAGQLRSADVFPR